MNLEKIHLILFLKPCYKWNTFNTISDSDETSSEYYVLNLVISGIPSIRNKRLKKKDVSTKF